MYIYVIFIYTYRSIQNSYIHTIIHVYLKDEGVLAIDTVGGADNNGLETSLEAGGGA
jgi:hypothetical protein